MGDFLHTLGTMIDQQFGLTDNRTNTLDTFVNGKPQQYGKLGDFSKKFDHTAERRYLEEGYTKHSSLPKVFEVMMQEPDITVLIKKKQFSSLGGQNRFEYMDNEDRLFLRTSAILFQNKCDQIAAYERLCKIERLAKADDFVATGMLPLIVDIVDGASNLPIFGNIFSTKFKDAIDKVRKLVAFNRISPVTSWMTDRSSLYKSSFGEGTGVIELNMVSSVTTNTSVKWGDGSFNLSVEDPYQLMVITLDDIERAISAALNPYYNSKFFQLGQQSLNDMIQRNKRLLNDSRKFRGASAINFVVNPDTFLGQKVKVIVDGSGIEIPISSSTNPIDSLTGDAVQPIPDEYLFGGEILGDDGLKPGKRHDEDGLVRDIVQALYSAFSLEANTKSKTSNFNKNSNYLREKMRLNYGSKYIISPMDVVHIYINSKTRVDSKLVGGLHNYFTGFNFMQKMSQDISALKNNFNALFNPSNDASRMEKDIFVGPDFPNYLWTMMRNQFTTDKAGTHVFAGLCGNPNGTYSNGKFQLNVSGTDFSGYFQMGKVNFQPAIAGVSDELYNPVTPFDVTYDRSTGRQRSKGDDQPVLLPENQTFLAKQSGAIRYKSGPLLGRPVTQANFMNQDSEKVKNYLIKIYHAPDGFVYRWKSGIATKTYADTETLANRAQTRQAIPRTTAEAFAGQDVMNVLTILITGEPHNFASFYKNAVQFDAFQTDDGAAAFRESPTYYRNLLDNIKRNNVMYGDFQPFKRLVYPDRAVQNAVFQQSLLVSNNIELESLLHQRSIVQDELFRSTVGGLSTLSSSSGAQNLAANTTRTQELKSIDDKIRVLQHKINDSLNQSNGSLTIQGDDVSFEPDALLNNQNGNSALHRNVLRRELRRKMNFLTRRLMYRVKSNTDANLMIVDDTYDKDTELQAYSKSLATNLSLLQSEHSYLKEQIGKTAGLLELEVFADSQGHIQVRNPGYNKMPNSVFNKMIMLKEFSGIQVFPKFIEDLYKNQIQTSLDNIAIIEDQIRLKALALNMTNDEQIQNQIGSNFRFISDPQTGIISNVNALLQESNNETSAAVIRQQRKVLDDALGKLSSDLSEQAKTRNVFAIATGPTDLATRIYTKKQVGYVTASLEIKNREELVRGNLQIKTGAQASRIVDFFSRTSTITGDNVSAADVFAITQDLVKLVAQRQNLMKTAASSVKSVRDAISVEDDKGKQRGIMFPNLLGKKEIPELLEHMIEDESYDDYGPGSGSRYVIQNRNILSYNISENAPQFNFVQVNGLFGEGYVDVGSDLRLGGDGNVTATAFAVDYDMWKMYGFRDEHATAAPFLSDPEAQCAPYAVSLLNRTRADILKGTCSIVGNEYQQPGEVIYLEPRDLLFYVESVQHSFTYGSSFETSLNLTYGRTVGQYIPTPYDVIGKLLYKNRDRTTNVVIKGDSAFNEQAISIVSTKKTPSFGQEPKDLVAQNGEANDSAISNAQFAAYQVLNPNTSDGQRKYKLEVRYYYYSNSKDSGKSAAPVMGEVAEYVAKRLTTNITDSKDKSSKNSKNPVSLTLPNDAVKVAPVNIGDPNETRHPSAKAWSTARALAAGGTPNLKDSLLQPLVKHVIDIWLVSDDERST